MAQSPGRIGGGVGESLGGRQEVMQLEAPRKMVLHLNNERVTTTD